MNHASGSPAAFADGAQTLPGSAPGPSPAGSASADPALTVLICTHDRSALLSRALESLNAAKCPAMPVCILVAANACSDDTVALMQRYCAVQEERGWLPLRVIEVPTPGKSHALNAAIPLIETELTAFVDDDHRVDPDFLCAIEAAAACWRDADMYCGRILPDWDGTEPKWVHDTGPYRIYPLPVPRYDQDVAPREITAKNGPIPGGGNLVLRRRVLRLNGAFSTTLGPHGHDLGGGEDSDYVLRAMARGMRCRYSPAIAQHHYVDNARLRLGYLLKKSYQRTRSTARIRGTGTVPAYMWRKLAEYAFQAVTSVSRDKRRFYCVRVAAALGEIHGGFQSGNRGSGLDLPMDSGMIAVAALGALAAVAAAVAWLASGGERWEHFAPTLAVAFAGTAALLAKSLRDFSQTGPKIAEAIRAQYRRYTSMALLRLCLWTLIIILFFSGAGVLVYHIAIVSAGWTWSRGWSIAAAAAGVVIATLLRFVHVLRFNPGLLVASMNYRMSRLYPLWRIVTPGRILALELALGVVVAVLAILATVKLSASGHAHEIVVIWAMLTFYATVMACAQWMPEARADRHPAPRPGTPPNILLIGSDTLRADRLGAHGYVRTLTPNIDALGKEGALFANCYVPCARTAPSLVSLLTGTWPHTHGIRDNFVADTQARLHVDAVPQLLQAQGYATAALSDWCGADMGKLSFGFELTDLPGDQWNLKYFARQGPKDLRLFVSLFAHNRFGRLLLSEIYYLGGVPLTTQMGRRARRLVSRLTAASRPFLLDVFYSTTHPPFASEWPWYTRFADRGYSGESKFAMAKLADPFEIIRRQGAPREEFDLDQVIDLYDGCVAQFDDEVGRMLRHLEELGIDRHTIVVVYSDHGMEFFEHDTWGQGNSAIGDHSPRIPLVIRDPRLPSAGTITGVVRSIDVAPTLMELAGLEPAATMEGRSLAARLRGDVQDAGLDAFNETGLWVTRVPGLPEDHLCYPDLLELVEVPDAATGTLAIKPQYWPIIIAARDRMIRNGRYKLTYQPLIEGHLLQLFDVVDDPTCHHNIIGRHPDVAHALWARLEPWIAGTAPEMRP